MASLRMKKREKRRIHLVKKYSEKRLRLLTVVRDPNASLLEKETAQTVLQKMPKDSSACRISNRCKITGRGHGVYRFVGLCRNMFRYYAMKGDIPGIRKSSW